MSKQELWGAVLTQALNDAKGSGMPEAPPEARALLAQRVRDWIGTEDFLDICDLAGVLITEAEPRFREALAEGPVNQEVGDRYDGLAPEVLEEVLGTRLDRRRYLRYLRTLDPIHAASTVLQHLDAGLTERDALSG